MYSLIQDESGFKGNSFVSVAQLTQKSIEVILGRASEIKKNSGKFSQVAAGKLLYSLFYNESTRTRFSTETAWIRLGGQVISVTGTNSTSLVKGETLDHTLEMYAGYQPDAIAIRCRQEGLPEYGAKRHPLVSWVNCGDGNNEHPTQAMLDLFTIREHFGELTGLRVAFVGDIKHGRTIKSLARVLKMYGVKMIFVAPDSLQDQSEFKSQGIDYDGRPISQLQEVLNSVDLVYATRPQLERMSEEDKITYKEGVYQITPDMMLTSRAMLMHPLPIDASNLPEIHPGLDGHPQSIYFEQAANGLWVRVAIFSLLLG